MEAKDQLRFSLDTQTLQFGFQEEKAAYGVFVVEVNGRCLTECVGESGELRSGPHVSGYHVAEWLVWNWWRLCYESRLDVDVPTSWDFAHRMSSIGEGYMWPNIEIYSDGIRAFFDSDSGDESASTPFRYVGGARIESLPLVKMQGAIDSFVLDILKLIEKKRHLRN